jgi:hypothetical protein
MPTLSKTYTLTITPEQFLENCSILELKELDLLIQSERYQTLIRIPLSNLLKEKQYDDTTL